MNISLDTNSLFPHTGNTDRARGLNRKVNPDGMTMEAEQTEEEKRLGSSAISFQRQLTPEEEKRVIFLQNLLSQLLTMTDGKPTDEQKARIKEVEEELEKITGVKMRSSISDTADKMVGKKDDDEDEEEKQKKRQLKGIDPKDAAHSTMPDTGKSNNPGMQMLQRQSMFANLQSMLDKSGPLSSLTT